MTVKGWAVTAGIGAAAGAVTVSRSGAALSVPSEEEVREFLEKRNVFL